MLREIGVLHGLRLRLEAQSPFSMVAAQSSVRGLGSGLVDFDVATRPDIEDSYNCGRPRRRRRPLLNRGAGGSRLGRARRRGLTGSGSRGCRGSNNGGIRPYSSARDCAAALAGRPAMAGAGRRCRPRSSAFPARHRLLPEKAPWPRAGSAIMAVALPPVVVPGPACPRRRGAIFGHAGALGGCCTRGSVAPEDAQRLGEVEVHGRATARRRGAPAVAAPPLEQRSRQSSPNCSASYCAALFVAQDGVGFRDSLECGVALGSWLRSGCTRTIIRR